MSLIAPVGECGLHLGAARARPRPRPRPGRPGPPCRRAAFIRARLFFSRRIRGSAACGEGRKRSPWRRPSQRPCSTQLTGIRVFDAGGDEDRDVEHPVLLGAEDLLALVEEDGLGALVVDEQVVDGGAALELGDRDARRAPARTRRSRGSARGRRAGRRRGGRRRRARRPRSARSGGWTGTAWVLFQRYAWGGSRSARLRSDNRAAVRKRPPPPTSPCEGCGSDVAGDPGPRPSIRFRKDVRHGQLRSPTASPRRSPTRSRTTATDSARAPRSPTPRTCSSSRRSCSRWRRSEDEAIAALLHDVIEDGGGPEAEAEIARAVRRRRRRDRPRQLRHRRRRRSRRGGSARRTTSPRSRQADRTSCASRSPTSSTTPARS